MSNVLITIKTYTKVPVYHDRSTLPGKSWISKKKPALQLNRKTAKNPSNYRTWSFSVNSLLDWQSCTKQRSTRISHIHKCLLVVLKQINVPPLLYNAEYTLCLLLFTHYNFKNLQKEKKRPLWVFFSQLVLRL